MFQSCKLSRANISWFWYRERSLESRLSSASKSTVPHNDATGRRILSQWIKSEHTVAIAIRTSKTSQSTSVIGSRLENKWRDSSAIQQTSLTDYSEVEIPRKVATIGSRESRTKSLWAGGIRFPSQEEIPSSFATTHFVYIAQYSTGWSHQSFPKEGSKEAFGLSPGAMGWCGASSCYIESHLLCPKQRRQFGRARSCGNGFVNKI